MEILLCTNGSTGSRAALRLGVHVASALRLPATILGIIETPKRRMQVTSDVREALEQLRSAGIATNRRIVTGNAQQIIEIEAKQGDFLTVLGDLDPPMWRRLLRGPTMRHILDAQVEPLLCLYHAPDPASIEHVLICSGGLYQTDEAIGLGSRIAAAFGAQITLLHVATPHAHMPAQLQDMPDSPDAYLDGDTLYSNNLSDAMAELNSMGLSVDFQIRAGDPMLEILNVARSNSYDLVVIGSHAAVTGPARLIGDITHRIVEHAGRPVLVVRNQ